MIKFRFVSILLGIVIVVLSCNKPAQKPFRFVQLCDTQIGMGGYQHDLNTFNQAIAQINAIKPDFVVICGDLVNHAHDSTYNDFMRLYKQFKVKCYLAPGNHDVGNVPTKASLAYYRKMIGKDYFVFKNKGAAFVITNTQLWKEDVPFESTKHHSWFNRTMDSLGKGQNQIFVIGHYPIFIKSPDEDEVYYNLPKLKRQRILSVLIKNKVKAYLSGHKHEFIENNFENIAFVTGETTSLNFDKRPLGFRLWEVHSDSISHQFVPLKKE